MESARSIDALEADRNRHAETGAQLSARLVPAIRLVGVALLVAIFVRSFLLQPFAIPSGSMSPELRGGDFILVDKSAYGWALSSLPLAHQIGEGDRAASTRLAARPADAGDVIVFSGPDRQDFVKRVVAVGGDRVAMKAGRLILNGRLVDCTPDGPGLCRERLPNGQSHLIQNADPGPLADYPEIVVPAGQYFVLGDNRGSSADSRLSRADGGVGLVTESQLIGRAARIFFSARDGVRWGRIGQPID